MRPDAGPLYCPRRSLRPPFLSAANNSGSMDRASLVMLDAARSVNAPTASPSGARL